MLFFCVRFEVCLNDKPLFLKASAGVEALKKMVKLNVLPFLAETVDRRHRMLNFSSGIARLRSETPTGAWIATVY